MPVSVLIIGGGASGTLLAIRLLRDTADLHVTLTERSSSIGRGLAYATDDERHVLNVVPGRMSAFTDDPDHFRRWLIKRRLLDPEDTYAFVPRRHFGSYLEDTLQSLAADAGRLRVLHDTVVALRPSHRSATIGLASGHSIPVDVVVLATGHDTSYVPLAVAAADRDLPVLILGTGLSMADAWLSHAGSGRQVIAMSRHGLLPEAHGEAPPAAIEPVALPFGASATETLRWFRGFARRTGARAGDWRPAVDALRPHAQRLWTSWGVETRRRFLCHLKPWWDVHRHRLPAQVHQQLLASIDVGMLQVIAATPLSAKVGSGVQTVTFRRRGSTSVETVVVGAVLDCRGLVRDWRRLQGGLVARLVAEGHACIDELGLGLQVTDHNEIVAHNGHVQPNLFAIGPLTRGKWFEIEAVPDIRTQCDRVARHLMTKASCDALYEYSLDQGTIR